MNRPLLRGLVLLAAASASALYLFARSGAGEDGPDPRRLARWETQGCYELRLGPWRATPVPPTSGAAEDTGSAAGRARASPRLSEVPAAFDPPAGIMLLSDSVDLWGRTLPTRRAAATGSSSAEAGRRFRWMVRADTLWILWSEERARVGVALVPSDGLFEGSARARAAEDSVDASAGASAWRVNCATGAREERTPRRRR